MQSNSIHRILLLNETNRREYGAIYRKLVIESVEKIAKKYDDKLAILFSGGVDSLILLFSLLELGKKPKILYTIHLESYLSQDARHAIKMAEIFDTPIRIVPIKEDYPGKLIEHIYHFIYVSGIKRKSKIETIVPMMYLFDEIRRERVFQEENDVKAFLIGFGNDDINGSGKQTAIKKHDNFYFNHHRKQVLEWSMNVEIPVMNKLIADYLPVTIVDPYYESKTLQDFMLDTFTKWHYLHRPFEKWIVYYGFKDYFDKYPFMFRKKLNMQTESRFREYFQTVLETKNVIKLYNKLYKQCQNNCMN